MAAAAHGEDVTPRRRCDSMSDIFRQFKLNGLRVVLLGNNWSQRCLVINLIMNKDVLDVTAEPQCCKKHTVTIKDQTFAVINTPDLFQSDLTADRLTELVAEVAEESSPGPHVFLLVLQPETFTEQHQQRLQSILERFSEKPFDHVLVLLVTDQEEHVFVEKPALKTVVKECSFRYQWISHLEDKVFTRLELLTQLARVMKENSGHFVKHETFEEPLESSQDPTEGHKQVEPKQGTYGIVESVQKHGISAVRPKKTSQEFHFEILSLKILSDKIPTSVSFRSGKPSLREWEGKKIKKIKTANLLSLSIPEVIGVIKKCMKEFHQGPNVLLLHVSELTEKYIETLQLILPLFGPNALKHSILLCDKPERKPCANSLVEECDGRVHLKSKETYDELMRTVEALVLKNNGSRVSFTYSLSPKTEKLNLVLCGSKDVEKTQTTKAILGPVTYYTRSSSSKCVKRQAEVCGTMVTIVELPAVSEKPERDAMEECLSCVSMCDPEGVHAFVMVLPVAPLTDEDKAEFKIIQNTFSSTSNNFTVILFMVESDPKAKEFSEFVEHHKDIKNLIQSCRGHIFFNIKNPQQAPHVLEDIKKRIDWSQRFTVETFAKIQIEKHTQRPSSDPSFVKTNKDSEKTLRIVLIGKTGSGKSSSGNTILGREVFKSQFGQKAVTRFSQKEQSKLDGCRVDVVDTPGLFDKSMSNQEINEEMVKCISLLAPGPHVFLLVLGIGRFTPEENETLELIKKGFGEDAQKYTIVLFTHGDELDFQKTTVENFINDSNKCDVSCQKLINDCGNRYHVFNNRDETKRQQQVKELIQKIDALVEENGGGCYTNEMLKKAEAAIQKEVQKLMKEREEEFKREIQEMEEKHKQEIQEMQKRMDEERKETERVRREKDNELREMEVKINRGQELLKKEQEKRDEEELLWKEQDRVKRQEYAQKISELEENLQRSFDLKYKESKDKMQQERDEWEDERKEMWQKRQNEDDKRRNDEQVRLENLEQEYKRKLAQYREEKEKEDKLRHDQELKKTKELEEQHNQKIEDLKNKYETEARKQAEEFNEFQREIEADFAAKINEHFEEVKGLKEEIEQKQREYQSLQNLADRKESSLKSDMENLETQHKNQLIDLVIVSLMGQKENNQKIKNTQKKHKQEIEQSQQEISKAFENERKRQVRELKKTQQQEIRDLVKSTNEDDLQLKMKELTDAHENQIKDLESKLWNKRKNQLKESVDNIKKRHVHEMNKITNDLVKKNEEHWKKQITELEKKQNEEMNNLMKKAEGKVNEVDLDKLKTDHEIEMDKIKKRIFPKEELCSIL